jgi:uncharacterized protein (TIGR03083 family)
MDATALREHLSSQYALFHAAVTGADREARVPTCPEWSVDELTDHLAHVYRHKVECMRQGTMPEEWPPTWAETSRVARLESAWTELSAEFDARAPQDHAATWCTPDQTVGFWIRRMAHETTIHRIDAELGAGHPVSPIADDLGADCADEFVTIMLGWASVAWHENFAAALAGGDGRALGIEVTGGPSWSLAMRPEGIEVSPGGTAEATVAGDGEAVARWLWNRPPADVAMSGDPALVDRLRAFMAAAGG